MKAKADYIKIVENSDIRILNWKMKRWNENYRNIADSSCCVDLLILILKPSLSLWSGAGFRTMVENRPAVEHFNRINVQLVFSLTGLD